MAYNHVAALSDECYTNTPFLSLFFSSHTRILEEEIIDEASITNLSQREADAPIFSKLHLSYGKAVAFKEEFGRKVSLKRPCSPSAVKPTMADIATFTPELRRLYLSK